MQVGKGCVYEKSKGKMKSLICLGGLMFLTTAVMQQAWHTAAIVLVSVVTELAVLSETGEDKQNLPCCRLPSVEGTPEFSLWEGKGCSLGLSFCVECTTQRLLHNACGQYSRISCP